MPDSYSASNTKYRIEENLKTSFDQSASNLHQRKTQIKKIKDKNAEK